MLPFGVTILVILYRRGRKLRRDLWITLHLKWTDRVKIFGPIQHGEMWRARYNTELYEQYTEPDVTMMIKMARLRWRGHVIRMTATCQEDLWTKTWKEKKRGVGKHEVRWIGVVNNDKRKADVRNWRTEATYRDWWRRFTEVTEVHLGQQCPQRWWLRNCAITGSRREVGENCALLGYYTASSGLSYRRFGTIYRSQIQWSRIFSLWNQFQ